MSDEVLEDRVTELELRFMEQQAVIDALDGVVQEQDLALNLLRKELQQLRTLLTERAEFIDD